MARLGRTSLRYAVLCLLWMIRDGTCCEGEWVQYGDSCLRVVVSREIPRIASLLCSSADAHLASISTEGKLLFLSTLVANAESSSAYWIGLDGERWNDGTPAVHQPYVEQLTEANKIFCGAFDGAKVVRLRCSFLLNYICERKSSTQLSPSQCKREEVPARRMNKCILVLNSEETLTYSDASQMCSLSGHVAQLSEIFHESISHFSNLTKNGVNYWLSTKWEHMNSTHFGIFSEAFASNSSGSCLAISFNFENYFKFFIHRMDCDEKADAICFSGDRSYSPQERVRSTRVQFGSLLESCPHGYNWKEDTASGFCYWETSYETQKLSWDDARSYCQSYGGDLASFHSSDEEKIGLSFQYGSTTHRYWIGLVYDKLSESFVWSDGSPLNYSNWAAYQPSNLQKRRSCVQMDPNGAHWVVSYCGELCWFICKAPRQYNPKKPVLPTPEPMIRCSSDSLGYFFGGFCYEVIDISHDWHRALTYCRSSDSDLASVHSENEVDFLIRLLDQHKGTNANRVWVGLNANGYEGRFHWSDGSAYDFDHWDDYEPNNVGEQEQCVNMYINNGFWNDENCENRMLFICKKPNGTTLSPPATTQEPPAGNCPDGWYTFNNRCFLLIGKNEGDRADFLSASSRCRDKGGLLASVRNAREQAFLAFLIQNLKTDAWIGLSDRLVGYQWVDNSPLSFTNFAFGTYRSHESEDCVALNYNGSVSGEWRTANCDLELPFFCQRAKDPSIAKQAAPRETRCVYPQGWLKQGMSCYMLFSNDSSFSDANATCTYYHANLVSINDKTVEAVINYLTAGNEKWFWMGLTAKSSKFKWLNRWPLSISRWDTNQPSLRKGAEENCFVVSSAGLWKRESCWEKRPFVCQVTSGQPPVQQRVMGSCPEDEWVDLDDDYCYYFQSFVDSVWSKANFDCFSKGGNLVSIHSMSQLEKIKEYLRKEDIWVTSYLIGLTKNENGGFVWSDHSPVDFVNWAQAEPEDPSLHCVHMHSENLKWYTTSCESAKSYICSTKKDSNGTLSSEKLQHNPAEGQGISGSTIAIITVVGIIAVSVITGFLVMHFVPFSLPWSRLRSPDRVTSFENSLYKTVLSSGEVEDTSALHVRG